MADVLAQFWPWIADEVEDHPCPGAGRGTPFTPVAWGRALALVGSLGGVVVATASVAWVLLGLLDLPTWLAALLAIAAVLLLVPVIAWYVVPVVVGTLEGIREGLPGRPADPELLERFRSMSINDVRHRADDFDRRALAAGPGGSRSQRKRASTYRVPAHLWRRLEAAMRDGRAAEVGDLSDAEVERWGRRLELWREDEPEPPQRGPGHPQPQRRTVRLPTRNPD